MKGRSGGLALVKQRGTQYMSQIGRNGSRKRLSNRGGRPRNLTFTEKTSAIVSIRQDNDNLHDLLARYKRTKLYRVP